MRHSKPTKNLLFYTEKTKHNEKCLNSAAEKPFPRIIIPFVRNQASEKERKLENKLGKAIPDERNIILEYRTKKKEENKIQGTQASIFAGGDQSVLYRSLSQRRIDISGSEIIQRLEKRGIVSHLPTPPMQPQFARDSSSHSWVGSERYLATPKRKHLKQLYLDKRTHTKNVSCFKKYGKDDKVAPGENRRQVHSYMCCCAEERTFNLPSVE